MGKICCRYRPYDNTRYAAHDCSDNGVLGNISDVLAVKVVAFAGILPNSIVITMTMLTMLIMRFIAAHPYAKELEQILESLATATHEYLLVVARELLTMQRKLLGENDEEPTSGNMDYNSV